MAFDSSPTLDDDGSETKVELHERQESRTVDFSKFSNDVKLWCCDNWKAIFITIFAVLLGYYAHIDSYKVSINKPDVCSSIVSLEPLLQIEQKLVQALDSYANELQRKVDTIRNGLSKMRKPHEIQSIDSEKFLGNPFNSYPMLRRLKTEWKAWEEYLRASVGTSQPNSIRDALKTVMTYSISDRIQCIENVRHMYDVRPSNWVEGDLNRKTYDIKFSSLDAFSIGFLLFVKKSFTAADEWFAAALQSFEDSDMFSFLGYNRSFVVESYAENLEKQNRTDVALKLVNSALERHPKDRILLMKKAEYERSNVTPGTDSFDLRKEGEGEGDMRFDDSVKRGCRGDFAVNASMELFCYLNSSGNDFVRLAPFKVEKIFLEPEVLLYHDVVNDDEIFELKNIARKALQLTKNSNSAVPSRGPNPITIRSDENIVAHQVDRRIEDMLGLAITDELFQVENFGLGAFRKPTTDCQDNSRDRERKIGCSATVLIHMTDVESGGDTVFPNLEVSVLPQKGTALVWYNLQNDMEQCDMRTLHVDCPVVVGSKWVAVKRINVNKQTFRKPCYRNISDV